VATATARRATRRHGGSINQLTHEVRGLLVVRAILGLVFYAALGAWFFELRIGAWAGLPLPGAARWTGVVLLVPVLAFFAWSFRSLGASYRGGVGLHDGHELVTTGPYRFVRHPIYLAFVPIMLLVFLLSANWVIGLSGLCLVTSIAAARIPIEERQLAARFGPVWRVYCHQTGCLFPRVHRPPESAA